MDTPGNPEIIRVYTREKHDEWKKREKETGNGEALGEREKNGKKREKIWTGERRRREIETEKSEEKGERGE